MDSCKCKSKKHGFSGREESAMRQRRNSNGSKSGVNGEGCGTNNYEDECYCHLKSMPISDTEDENCTHLRKNKKNQSGRSSIDDNSG